MKLPILQIDAFTRTPLEGNACAVVFDADGLSDAKMQAIAREMNLSETAFVLAPRKGDCRARYFTPVEEIQFAGHPTIATVFALFASGRFAVEGSGRTIQLELPVGVIPVDVEFADGDVGNIVMTQNKPDFLAEFEPADVMPIFGLTPDDARPGSVIQVVSTGTPQLMIPLKDMAALHRATFAADPFESLRQAGGFFSPQLFCLEGFTPKGSTAARHFIPIQGVEDPFTGSATGGMAAYAWHYGLLEDSKFVAEQGHAMGRPGEARVEVVGDRDDIQSVRVGGGAAEVLRGELSL
jgi:trans-2,3-dihydro-3-hydroxyanthranilate isomerase